MKKAADRAKERKARQEELEAIRNGSWPRDLNDSMRWKHPHGRDSKDWAAHMCQTMLTYLDDLETRLAANDPDMEGWER